MIDKNINYKDLAEYIQLAIEEYEFYNNKNIKDKAIYDMLYWLNHFHYCNSNSRDIKERKNKNGRQ